jgi:TonB family protein
VDVVQFLPYHFFAQALAGIKRKPKHLVQFSFQLLLPLDTCRKFAQQSTAPFVIDIPDEVPVDTFLSVEKKPKPVAGYDSFYKQVSKSIRYPDKARRNLTEGTVTLLFVINQFGEPVNFSVLKGIGSGCDEEAIRVLSKTKWVPGRQRGRPVNVKITLPIKFNLGW